MVAGLISESVVGAVVGDGVGGSGVVGDVVGDSGVVAGEQPERARVARTTAKAERRKIIW